MTPTAIIEAPQIDTIEARFRAMGSDVHVVIVAGPAGLAAYADNRIQQLEARWSRFQPTSEICALNRCAGHAEPVSDDTRLLIVRAVEAWRLTGGSFDPTMLDAIEAAGYDRSFEMIADEGGRSRTVRPIDAAGCVDIVIDHDAVTIPAGLGFDPGGIGKGLAADIVAGELIAAGATGACVNMGGDLRVIGASPNGNGWTVAIDHPWSSVPVALVGLTAGAVATSTVLRRRWTIDGCVRHHLIDPSTSEPSTSDLALASVIAGTAWQAEVLAKAALLRGSDRAFDLLDGSNASLVVDRDGAVSASAGLANYLGGVALDPTVTFDRQTPAQG